ncbi:hypothetical protein [Salinarimonas rosea]|uniref:hypothetical protein n=1 Tax=Salinarimonas rosea TaxID=552063 RepID=UPI000415E755|nr:hypothetical protein [Salinarimonas rosea]
MIDEATHPNAGSEAREARMREAAGPGRAPAILVSLGVAALAGAGLLMWAAQGPAVFNEVVLAALAWCF